MKLLLIALLLAGTVAFIVAVVGQIKRHVAESNKEKWRPAVLNMSDGTTSIVCERPSDHSLIVINKLQPGHDPVEARIWLDEAKQEAKLLNKRG